MAKKKTRKKRKCPYGRRFGYDWGFDDSKCDACDIENECDAKYDRLIDEDKIKYDNPIDSDDENDLEEIRTGKRETVEYEEDEPKKPKPSKRRKKQGPVDIILKQGHYMALPEHLIQFMGLPNASFLTALLYHYKYLRKQGIARDGQFYFSSPLIQAKCGVKRNNQTKALKQLTRCYLLEDTGKRDVRQQKVIKLHLHSISRLIRLLNYHNVAEEVDLGKLFEVIVLRKRKYREIRKFVKKGLFSKKSKIGRFAEELIRKWQKT